MAEMTSSIHPAARSSIVPSIRRIARAIGTALLKCLAILVPALAALLVLFSAMLDPLISLALSIVALLALGVYNFVFKGR
jgi:hypothetical protein